MLVFKDVEAVKADDGNDRVGLKVWNAKILGALLVLCSRAQLRRRRVIHQPSAGAAWQKMALRQWGSPLALFGASRASAPSR